MKKICPASGDLFNIDNDNFQSVLEKGNTNIVSYTFIESIIWGEGYQAFIYKIEYHNQNCDLDAFCFCGAPQTFKTSHFLCLLVEL